MRIKVITPIRVTEEELDRRQRRYRTLSPASVETTLFNLPEGAPRSLASERDIRTSERFVVEEAMRADPSEYDAVLPDCVLDPGLDELERECPISTFGILKLSAGFLRLLGHDFASVTRNEPIGEELKSRLRAYGYADRFDGNAVLDLSFEDIADDVRWNAALEQTSERFAGTGTTAIINGCSAVEVEARDGVAVVDPTSLALRVLDVVSETGTTPPTKTVQAPR